MKIVSISIFMQTDRDHDHDFFATLHDIYVKAVMLQLFEENLTLIFLNGRLCVSLFCIVDDSKH